MADPISILGTAGAVANIIDVLGKLITTFAELRSQWQEADLAVLALESELAALNAALTKIKEWAVSCSDDPHHQLTMDLDRCVVCCRLLIARIDAELSQFQTTAENRLDTAAMTLLLTACNTTMLSKQKGLLEDTQTRRVFKTMQDDTASLLVHRDVDSLLTGTATSITSFKRSIIFHFDSTLFTSRIYQRWIRGSVKKALFDQQTEKGATTSGSKKVHVNYQQRINRKRWETEDSQMLAQLLKQTIQDTNKESLRVGGSKVLVIGDRSRADIICAISLHAYTKDGPEAHASYDCCLVKHRTLEYAFRCAKAFADALQKHQVAPKTEDIWRHISYIQSAKFRPTLPRSANCLGRFKDPKFASSVAAIISSSYFSMDQCDDLDLPIQLYPTSNTGSSIWSISFPADAMHSFYIELTDPKGYERRDEMEHWLPKCDSVDAILFVVDVDSYNPLDLGDSKNPMTEKLQFFESVVNSKSMAGAHVILVFNKIDVFQERLKLSPPESQLPGSESKSPPGGWAFEPLLSRITELNRV
ncbi:G-protein alpha subunit-domain-containing protein [Rhypophila decipiens]|uniref:G-protein alpha subunit-domain-containing protein n=1 Tax=Rhypophila decipiens TaxID=261697 RepID=A0AAN7B1U1_9PEZI|nr:G-protein alpha subunit-domain-containing protein [Rhypophila decipiens]